MSGVNWTEAQLAEYEGRTDSAPKRNKFNARKKEVDGHLFDSTREARHYVELRALESAGVISQLELQPVFLLQPKRSDPILPKLRKIEYRADFEFLRGGKWVVQDVKSKATRTAAYRIKAKLFQAKFPDIIFEEIL